MSSPKPDNPEPRSSVTYVRLTREQREQIDAIARAEHRTTSDEIRRLIDMRIAEYEPPDHAA